MQLRTVSVLYLAIVVTPSDAKGRNLLVWGRVFDPAGPSQARLGFLCGLLQNPILPTENPSIINAGKRQCVTWSRRCVRELVFRPFGASSFSHFHPRFSPWALFLRRFAAGILRPESAKRVLTHVQARSPAASRSILPVRAPGRFQRRRACLRRRVARSA